MHIRTNVSSIKNDKSHCTRYLCVVLMYVDINTFPSQGHIAVHKDKKCTRNDVINIVLTSHGKLHQSIFSGYSGETSDFYF